MTKKLSISISIILLIWLTLTSLNYQSPVREPFEEYNKQLQQPQMVQPYYAPQATDWNNLPYDDPTWGWYYKLMWYLNHPNSTEIPPWELPQTPLTDDITILTILTLIYITMKNIHGFRYILQGGQQDGKLNKRSKNNLRQDIIRDKG